MRDPDRRNRILKAAAALFFEHGFDGTTLIEVSKASRAAVGSITHFFGDKSALAAYVHDDLLGDLAADAETALGGHGTDVEAAIRALVAACLGWKEKFPPHRRLIRMLEVYAVMSDRSR